MITFNKFLALHKWHATDTIPAKANGMESLMYLFDLMHCKNPSVRLVCYHHRESQSD